MVPHCGMRGPSCSSFPLSLPFFPSYSTLETVGFQSFPFVGCLSTPSTKLSVRLPWLAFLSSLPVSFLTSGSARQSFLLGALNCIFYLCFHDTVPVPVPCGTAGGRAFSAVWAGLINYPVWCPLPTLLQMRVAPNFPYEDTLVWVRCVRTHLDASFLSGWPL